MTIQEILALIGIKLPTNNVKKITAKDVRDSFELIGTKIDTISAGYKDSLKIADPKPTAPGLYRLLEFGNYVNLTPAVDSSGNPTVISSVDGKLNEAYFNGSVWIKSSITLPGSTAKQVYDSNDNINPATMKTSADWVLDNYIGDYPLYKKPNLMELPFPGFDINNGEGELPNNVRYFHDYSLLKDRYIV